MRRNWHWLWLTLALAAALTGAGCSGINASGSVSPLSFFLPGLVHEAPQQASPEAPPSPTDGAVAPAEAL